MTYLITITYDTNEPMDDEYPGNDVHGHISDLLNAALPYMVDNVTIHFDTEEV